MFVSPLLEASQVGDSTIDLRLGQHFLVHQPSQLSVLDVYELSTQPQNELVLEDGYSPVRIPYGSFFTLHARQTVRIGTLEYIGLPKDLQGEVSLRHSISNIPVMASIAKIQPGYRGVIILNLENREVRPIKLFPGMRIAQMELRKLSQKLTMTNTSRYFSSVVPGPSRIDEDEEIRYLGPTVNPFIIGIVSTVASGRTTILQYLTRKYGFVVFSLAMYIKEVALREGIEPEKTKLQNLGNKLRERYGNDYLATQLRQSHKWLENKHPLVIVDSFKHIEEVREFRKQSRFILLGIDSDVERRRTRDQARPKSDRRGVGKDFDFVDKIDRGLVKDVQSNDQQVFKVLKEADEIIINNFDSFEELYDELENILKGLEVFDLLT